MPAVAPGVIGFAQEQTVAKRDPNGFSQKHPIADEIARLGTSGCLVPEGRCTWEHTFGGQLEDKLYALVATPDDGLIAVGNTRSFGTGAYDAVALRLNLAGALAWTRRVGGRGTDQVYGADLDAAQGVVMAGHTRSKGKGRSDIWVVRLDRNGEVSWDRTFGGTGEDRARGVAATEDGGSVVVGFTGSNTEKGVDGLMLRLDAGGNLLWTRELGRPGEDGLFDVAVFPDGSIAAVWHSKRKSTPGFDLWVVRLDAAGIVQWQRFFGRGLLDAGTAAFAVRDGGLLAAGVTSKDAFGRDDAWVLHLDGEGSLPWQETLGGHGQDKAWAAVGDGSGHAVIAIATTSLGAGSTDARLVCLYDRGNLLWEWVYGGRLWDRPASLAIGWQKQIVLGGHTTTKGAGYEDFWILRLDQEGRL